MHYSFNNIEKCVYGIGTWLKVTVHRSMARFNQSVSEDGLLVECDVTSCKKRRYIFFETITVTNLIYH